MKCLVLLVAAASCHAASLGLPYAVVPGVSRVIHTDSLSPAVTKIAKPGIRFNVPSPVTYSAPAPVTYSAPAVPVQIAAAPVQIAAAPATVVQAAPAPVVQTYSAPAPVQAVVKAAPAPVLAAAPVAPSVAIAQAPEPLQAPNPPMPSVGTPFTGGQFHAQDELGQYSFGHFGGPNTRVEQRDAFGRTTGSFAYVDPIGDVQVRKYAAAPASGFKVAASDLP